LNPALPVILMSVFCGANLKARAEAVGAKAVLFKPLKATQLAQCLAAVFARPVGAEQADTTDAYAATGSCASPEPSPPASVCCSAWRTTALSVRARPGTLGAW